jgi:hypothetical protein
MGDTSVEDCQRTKLREVEDDTALPAEYAIEQAAKTK